MSELVLFVFSFLRKPSSNYKCINMTRGSCLPPLFSVPSLVALFLAATNNEPPEFNIIS